MCVCVVCVFVCVERHRINGERSEKMHETVGRPSLQEQTHSHKKQQLSSHKQKEEEG